MRDDLCLPAFCVPHCPDDVCRSLGECAWPKSACVAPSRPESEQRSGGNENADRGTELCGATDGLGVTEDGEPYGRCDLPAGHEGWHQETRDGRLWAEWRGPAPGERCGICGKDGHEH